MSFEDEVLRAEREMGRHHGAREDLSDAISDLGDEIRDYDFSGESEMEREFERFARTMGDYLENDRQEVEEETDQLEDILEDLRDQRSQTYGGFGTYRHGTGPQPFNWGMQQQQGVFGQQQRIGWNSFWSNPYQQQQGYGHQQQQSQGQNWQEEFFGNSDEADILDEDDNSNEEGPADIDETADESESNGYEDTDSYQPDEDPDGSVDMGDSWNPDASFDYEAEQSTETVNQSFSFSGSGFEPSGSITMEQSAGGEQQYFEASF
jgi:hypothetical protein